MPWTITGQQTIGVVQYLTGEHDTSIAPGSSTDELKIAGYSINISFTSGAVASGASLDGSLDGTNFFTIPNSTITTIAGINNISSTIVVNFIRLVNSSGGNFSRISFSANASIE